MLAPFQLFVQLSAKGTGRRACQRVGSAAKKLFTKRRPVFSPTVFSDRVTSHKGPGAGAIDVVQTQQAQTHAARWVEHRQH